MGGDRICLVTGATAGIGLATATALARAGASVFVAGRTAARGEVARQRIRERSGRDVTPVMLELGSFASIRAAAAGLGVECLDVLVNSAGHTYQRPERTVDGLDAAFAVNVLGPFLLTNLLSPLLARSRSARIVDLAGVYHRRGELDVDDLGFERRGFDVWAVANATQSARVALVQERARRLPPNVTVNAVHPGAVLTDAQKDLPWGMRLLIHTVLRPGFVRPERGAEPVVRLATSPEVEGKTGRFYRRYREEEPGYSPDLAAALWARCVALTGG